MIEDFGENYEYLRVIVNNSIELKKIEWAEKISCLAGAVSYILLVGLLSMIGFVSVLAALFLLLEEYFASSTQASLIISGLMFLLILLSIVFKDRIASPVKKYVARILHENL